MAAKKNPARDAALKEFVKSRGNVTLEALAEKLNVSVSQLRRWKKLDKWEDALKKKRGAPKGNKNAVGAGAPKKNKNAEKHGIYSSVLLEDLNPEQRARIEGFCGLPPEEKLNNELKKLLAQEIELQEKAKVYSPFVENGEIVEFLVQDKKVVFDNGEKEFTTITMTSQFNRWVKIIEKIGDINKAIQKIVQTMITQQRDKGRLDLDERKHDLDKQKVAGVFEVEDEVSDAFDELTDVSDSNDG